METGQQGTARARDFGLRGSSCSFSPLAFACNWQLDIERHSSCRPSILEDMVSCPITSYDFTPTCSQAKSAFLTSYPRSSSFAGGLDSHQACPVLGNLRFSAARVTLLGFLYLFTIQRGRVSSFSISRSQDCRDHGDSSHRPQRAYSDHAL